MTEHCQMTTGLRSPHVPNQGLRKGQGYQWGTSTFKWQQARQATPIPQDYHLSRLLLRPPPLGQTTSTPFQYPCPESRRRSGADTASSAAWLRTVKNPGVDTTGSHQRYSRGPEKSLTFVDVQQPGTATRTQASVCEGPEMYDRGCLLPSGLSIRQPEAD